MTNITQSLMGSKTSCKKIKWYFALLIIALLIGGGVYVVGWARIRNYFQGSKQQIAS